MTRLSVTELMGRFIEKERVCINLAYGNGLRRKELLDVMLKLAEGAG